MYCSTDSYSFMICHYVRKICTFINQFINYLGKRPDREKRTVPLNSARRIHLKSTILVLVIFWISGSTYDDQQKTISVKTDRRRPNWVEFWQRVFIDRQITSKLSQMKLAYLTSIKIRCQCCIDFWSLIFTLTTFRTWNETT